MNINEEWRSINHFPRYQVSSVGRVRSVVGKIYKLDVKDGYPCLRLDGVRKLVHRLVAEEFIENHDERKVMVDHIDRDRSNNNIANLRWVTPQQNRMNSSKHIDGRSQYKGVSWNKEFKKWRVQITWNRKKTHVGYYSDEAEAAKAYNEAAKEKFGEYAALNVIE